MYGNHIYQIAGLLAHQLIRAYHRGMTNTNAPDTDAAYSEGLALVRKEQSWQILYLIVMFPGFFIANAVLFYGFGMDARSAMSTAILIAGAATVALLAYTYWKHTSKTKAFRVANPAAWSALEQAFGWK